MLVTLIPACAHTADASRPALTATAGAPTSPWLLVSMMCGIPHPPAASNCAATALKRVPSECAHTASANPARPSSATPRASPSHDSIGAAAAQPPACVYFADHRLWRAPSSLLNTTTKAPPSTHATAAAESGNGSCSIMVGASQVAAAGRRLAQMLCTFVVSLYIPNTANVTPLLSIATRTLSAVERLSSSTGTAVPQPTSCVYSFEKMLQRS